MLNMKTDDLMKVIKGRDIKKQFINENKEQIRQYMNYIMAQEDKMMGYVEYTNQNMSEHYQIQKAMKEKEMKKGEAAVDDATRERQEKELAINNAVLCIQSFFRGFLVRQELKRHPRVPHKDNALFRIER